MWSGISNSWVKTKAWCEQHWKKVSAAILVEYFATPLQTPSGRAATTMIGGVLGGVTRRYKSDPLLPAIMKGAQKGFLWDVCLLEDILNYDKDNLDENVVFSSNFISYYNGVPVVNTPFDASVSFKIIGLSTRTRDVATLKHEYGHILQFEKLGLKGYFTNVFMPSITANILDRMGKLPEGYAYYGSPWEAEADRLRGVYRTDNNTPWQEDAYASYCDLISTLFNNGRIDEEPAPQPSIGIPIPSHTTESMK